MADERSGAQPPRPAGPVLTLAANNALAGARFHLVSARIAWTDGRCSQGWGRDPDLQAAQMKAGCEAVERHACATLPAAAAWARPRALGRWIRPDALVRYEPRQWERPGFPLARFSPREERCWLPARGLAGVADASVLADFACNPRAFAAPYRARLVTHATSSGCACGRSLDDAIARAVLELVERDAFMRHWFAQEPGRGLRSASLPRWCRARLEALHWQGCRAGVQSLVRGAHPVLLAWAQHGGRHFTSVGTACGFDAEAALQSAMAEMETQALARLAGVPPVRMVPAQVRGPSDHAALHATPRYFDSADRLLDGAGSETDFREVAVACRTTPAALYAQLRQHRHPVRWVDLSLPEAGNFLAGQPLYTVRALAERLVPIAFGLALQPFGMMRIARGGRLPHPLN